LVYGEDTIGTYKKLKIKILAFFLALWNITNSFSRAEQKQIHYLFENTVESERYEIKIIKSGYSSKDILFDTINKTFIIQRENIDRNTDYWKVNEKGYIIDSFYYSSYLLTSGVFFEETFYIDWVITGNKSKQQYQAIINADELSEKAFKNYLDSADTVDFWINYKLGKVRCFLNINNQWIVLESFSRVNDFELAYGKRYHEITSSIYSKKNSDRLQLLTDIIKPFAWEDPNNKIHIQQFVKEGYRFASLFDYNNLDWSGTYGTGYFQIDHEGEQLNFKTFVYKKNDYYNPDLHFYLLPETISEDIKTNFILLTSRPMSMRDSKEIGLYVLREKISTYPDAIASYEKSGVSFSGYEYNTSTFDWRVLFNGFTPEKGLIRTIRYLNGKQESILQPFSEPVTLNKRPPFEAITFFWEGPENESGHYHILFDDVLYLWENANDGILFQFHFDPIQIRSFIEQLSVENQPIDLVISMEAFSQEHAFLSMALTNGKESLALTRADARMTGNQSEFDRKQLKHHFEQGRLKLSFEAALKEPLALPTFFKYSQYIAENKSWNAEYRSLLASHTTKLLIDRTKNKDFQSAKQVFYHYLNNLLPHVGASNKTMDIASNGLALCVLGKDSEVCDAVFTKLLPDFDIEKLNNEVLLFNLSGYYSLNREKAKMLQAIRQARLYGKEARQFLNDSDFKHYWQDPDFLKEVGL